MKFKKIISGVLAGALALTSLSLNLTVGAADVFVNIPECDWGDNKYTLMTPDDLTGITLSDFSTVTQATVYMNALDLGWGWNNGAIAVGADDWEQVSFGGSESAKQDPKDVILENVGEFQVTVPCTVSGSALTIYCMGVAADAFQWSKIDFKDADGVVVHTHSAVKETPEEPEGTVLWTGSCELGDWANSINDGINGDKFASAVAGDKILVEFTDVLEGAQLSVKSKASGWPALSHFNEIDSEYGCYNIANGTTSYEFALNEADITALQSEGMVVAGKNATITSVKLIPAAGGTDDPEGTPYSLAWEGSTDLGTEWKANVQIPSTEFAGKIAEGDTVKISFSVGSAEYQQIKIMSAGDNWPVLTSLNEILNVYDSLDIAANAASTSFEINAADVTAISADGMVIAGYNLTITSVEINPDKKPVDDNDDNDNDNDNDNDDNNGGSGNGSYVVVTPTPDEDDKDDDTTPTDDTTTSSDDETKSAIEDAVKDADSSFDTDNIKVEDGKVTLDAENLSALSNDDYKVLEAALANADTVVINGVADGALLDTSKLQLDGKTLEIGLTNNMKLTVSGNITIGGSSEIPLTAGLANYTTNSAENAFLLSLDAHGAVEGGSFVVSFGLSAMDGKKVSIYKLEDGKLVATENSITYENGRATITFSSLSDYVLLFDEKPADNSEDNPSTGTAGTFVSISVIGIAAFAAAAISRKKK